MSRITFFCIPAWGHTNPTVEVVRTLVRQGHQVRYYSFAPFREKLEDAGAEVVLCDAFCRRLRKIWIRRSEKTFPLWWRWRQTPRWHWRTRSVGN